MGTSCFGVKNRMEYSPSGCFSTKAVSENPISIAMFRIVLLSNVLPTKQTAGGVAFEFLVHKGTYKIGFHTTIATNYV